MITSKKIVLATLLIAAAGGVFSEARLVSRRDEQLKTQRKKAELLIAEIRLARTERDEVQQSREATQPTAAASPDPAETAPAADSATDTGAKIWLARLHVLKQQLALHPEQQIPELKLLTERDWLQTAQSAQLGNNEQILAAFADLRATAKATFANQIRAALKKFTQASGGELPADIGQLSAYGDPPLDPAMLARYTLSRTGRVDSINEMLVIEKSPVNPAAEGRLSVSLSGLQTENTSVVLPPGLSEFPPATLGAAESATGFIDVTPALSQDVQQELTHATEAYARAHNGKMPAQLSPEDLRPYVTDPAKLDEFLRVLQAEAGKHPEPGR